MYEVSCDYVCKSNPSQPLPGPDYPPPWGGGGTTPPDPTVLAVTCPSIPATAVAGAAALLVRVMGQNFTNGCAVLLDGVAQATTFVNTSELNFTLTPGATARTATIQVDCGGTIATGTCQFTITAAPLMTVVCPCVPATAVVGTAPLQVTVNGTLFTTTSKVTLDGVVQTTVYVSATQLRATIDPSAETARIGAIGVTDGAVTAAQTCPFEFTVVLVPPVVTSVVPDYIGNWDPPKEVTVTGTGFDATTFITMNLKEYIPTSITPTEVKFMTTDAISNATLTLRAHNGTMANASNPLIFMCVENPTLGMLSPTTMSVAAPQTPLYVLGSGYGNTAKILFDGVIQPTTIFNGGQVTCMVTPSLYTPGQVVNVTVQLGHDPAHVDNVLPVNSPNTNPPNGPVTLPLTFTA